MGERVIQRASLIGRAVEDLTYEGLNPGRFTAELKGFSIQPEYKEGGFFIFSNLRPRDYSLRLSGEGFQSREYSIEIPSASPFFGQLGDDELIVAVKSVNGTKITFDNVNVILTREIHAGAKVVTQIGATSGTTTLAETMEPGEVLDARLASVAGLAPGALVRIIRGQGFRMRFSPYHRFPSEPTRIVGRVSSAAAPEIPLPGARVSVTEVNGVSIDLSDVGPAADRVKIAAVTLGGKKTVLGAEADVATFANERGDYNLYLSIRATLNSLTLRAELAGYQPQAITEPIAAGQRRQVSFQLDKI